MLKSALIVFRTVCNAGSFTKASNELFITPSAVMQKIDALEADYGVTLLNRSNKGVTPTRAGSFLLSEINIIEQRCADTLEKLKIIDEGNENICVGTSYLEKCRLIYDLWTLYIDKRPDCKIQLVNISSDKKIPDSVDMIESVNGGISWMRSWQFFEICRVPMGIAMTNTHPLAKRRLLSIQDLLGQRVIVFTDSINEDLAKLAELLDRSGVIIDWQEKPTSSVFDACRFHGELLLTPMCWNDILPSLELRKVDWKYSIPYGIFTRKNQAEKAADFLNFIKDIYNGNNPNDIVPML